MNNLGRFHEIARKWRMGSRFRDDLNPKGHDYAATYIELLSKRPIRKILEIGVGPAALFHPEQVAGAGLHFWAELFPEAHVFGADIRPDTLVNEGRIRSYLCDQSDPKQLSDLAAMLAEDASITHEAAGFDLIIDDGSHEPHDQALTAKYFLPMLSDSGVYALEDIFACGHTERALQGLVPAFIGKTIPLRTNELVDDRLIVMEREKLV